MFEPHGYSKITPISIVYPSTGSRFCHRPIPNKGGWSSLAVGMLNPGWRAIRLAFVNITPIISRPTPARFKSPSRWNKTRGPVLFSMYSQPSGQEIHPHKKLIRRKEFLSSPATKFLSNSGLKNFLSLFTKIS